MKKLYLFSILGLCFLLISFLSKAQTASSDNKKQVFAAIDVMAKYTYEQTGYLDVELERLGFKPPVNISSSEWNRYPVVRKLEWAYLSAETRAKGNGDKMLALLSKNLAQQYESVPENVSLKYFYNIQAGGKISFGSISALPEVSSVSAEVKKAILAISGYVDSDALGGLSNILIDHLNVEPDAAFDIIRKSKNTKEALLKGISTYSDVAVQKAKITNVVQELNLVYESSRFEHAFQPFTTYSDRMNIRQGVSAGLEHPVLNKAPAKGTTGSFVFSNTKVYETFVNTNYSKPEARGFSKMKFQKGGFGGVIFGNTIRFDRRLDGLKSVKWIPGTETGALTGSIEFIYSNNSKKYIHNILVEDFHCLYQLFYNTKAPSLKFKEGNGIGLASLSYARNSDGGSDYTSHDGKANKAVLLHPSVSNYAVAWPLLYSDVAPIIYADVVSKIKNTAHRQLVLKVLADFGDWKVTDVPLLVTLQEEEIVIKNIDKNAGPGNEFVFYTMVRLAGKKPCNTIPDTTTFNSISSILYKNNYNYKRLNDFIKAFAIFRYIKKQNIQHISAVPAFDELTLQPYYIKLDSSGAYFERPKSEAALWKEEIARKNNRYNKAINGDKQAYSGKYDSVILNLSHANNLGWNLIDDWYYNSLNKPDLCIKVDSLLSTNRLVYTYLSYRKDAIIDSLIANDKEFTQNYERLQFYSNLSDSLFKQFNDVKFIEKKCPSIYVAYNYIIYQRKIGSSQEKKALLQLIMREIGCECNYYRSVVKKQNEWDEKNKATGARINEILLNHGEYVLVTSMINELKAIYSLLSEICNK
jgi:hypothetical protein